MASSATLAVAPVGALTTFTSFFAAVSRSTLSTPMPALPITFKFPFAPAFTTSAMAFVLPLTINASYFEISKRSLSASISSKVTS